MERLFVAIVTFLTMIWFLVVGYEEIE